MRFEHVTSYAAPADRVLAMLTDPAFREEVCRAQKAVDHRVEVTGSGAGARVLIDRTQSMDRAPAAARRVVGQAVRVVQREHWVSDDRAELDMEIPGRPGHLHGGIRLRPRADGGCDEVFSGDVRVHVPLFGGRLESLVDWVLHKALTREGDVGHAWLASR